MRSDTLQTPECVRKTNALLESPDGAHACPHLDCNPAQQVSDFCPIELRDNKFMVYNPLRLWRFAVVAIGN